MATILANGLVQFADGRILYSDTPLTGQDFMELQELLPRINPIIGRSAMVGFPFVSGGGGGGSPGARGVDGTPGATGPQGVTGPGAGAQGVTGVQGQTGAQGQTGIQGPTGPANPNDIFAATRVVDQGGAGTDTTIAAAIAALPAAGGDIYVKGGTYPIAASLDFTTKVVRLRGAGTSVDFATGPVTLVPAANISVFKNGAQGCSIEDITIEGDNASSQALYEGSAEIRFTRIDVHDVAGIIKFASSQPEVTFRDSYINVPSGVTIPLADRFLWKGAAANGKLIFDNVELFVTGSGATLMSGVTAGANGPEFRVVNSYVGGGGGGGSTNFWFAQVLDWVSFDIDNAQIQVSGARNNIVNCNFLDCSLKFLAIWNFVSNCNFSQGGTNGGGGIFDAQLSFEQAVAGVPIQSTVTGCNFYGNAVSNKGISITGLAGASSTTVTIMGCTFSNHTLNNIFISAGLDVMITGCNFDHSAGGVVNAISIVAGASFSARITIVGNSFGSGYTTTVSTAGFNSTIANNINLLAVSDTGNANVWTGNTNFDPSGLTGSAASDIINDTNVIGPIGVDTTLTLFYRTVTVDASAGNRTVTLPTAATSKWRKYIIKKVDATANTVTIDADGAETIDGALTQVLTTQYQFIEIQSDGSTWWIV